MRLSPRTHPSILGYVNLLDYGRKERRSSRSPRWIRQGGGEDLVESCEEVRDCWEDVRLVDGGALRVTDEWVI